MPVDPSRGPEPSGPSLASLTSTVLALAGVRRGYAVLDVCAGAGLCVRAAAAGTAGEGLVVAVDADPGVLQAGLAGPTDPAWAPIRWVRASPAALPLRAASFDAVLCAAVPVRDLDLDRVLPELRRVARVGARVVVGGATGSVAKATTRLAAHGFTLAHLSETTWAGGAVWHIAARRT